MMCERHHKDSLSWQKQRNYSREKNNDSRTLTKRVQQKNHFVMLISGCSKVLNEKKISNYLPVVNS